jgi:regulator of sigma E protease
LTSVIYAIIALGVLIFAHELGHFLVARLANVKVLAFSLGFGKKLLSFKRGETEYALSAVPLGGYVKLLGESPDEEVPEAEIPRSYTHKPPITKILIGFAGPFFNILLACLLFFLIFLSGQSVLSTKVGSVEKGFPADVAGIKAGDVITSINGKQIEEWTELMDIMAKSDLKPMKFGVRRDGQSFDTMITPREMEATNIFGEKVTRKVIGIVASNAFLERKETLGGAASKAVIQTYTLSELTVVGIVKLIKGSISPKNIGGPLLILEAAGKQAKEGKRSFAYFVAIISINLAVVNLLPIPILDGGHILFYLIELVTRRRISQRTIEISQKVGITVLILIMVLAFSNDLCRLFPNNQVCKTIYSKRLDGGG